MLGAGAGDGDPDRSIAATREAGAAKGFAFIALVVAGPADRVAGGADRTAADEAAVGAGIEPVLT